MAELNDIQKLATDVQVLKSEVEQVQVLIQNLITQ
jgi:hypothetical protein